MSNLVDARGLPCPGPVVRAVSALESSDIVTIIVDNTIARDNILRMAAEKRYSTSIDTRADGIYLTINRPIHKSGEKAESAAAEHLSPAQRVVVYISSDILGRGENQSLGSLLMQSFLHTIAGMRTRPDTIICMNDGVKLAADDSPVLGALKEMALQGVEILVCGTCLSRLQLTAKLAVGQVSNMYTITETMLKAGKVISL